MSYTFCSHCIVPLKNIQTPLELTIEANCPCRRYSLFCENSAKKYFFFKTGCLFRVFFFPQLPRLDD